MPPAKYRGVCVRCHLPYAAGDEVTWSRRGEPGQYHVGCKDIKPGSVGAPVVAPPMAVITPMPIIAPSPAPEPTEALAVATADDDGVIECQCPHLPDCPAYVEPEAEGEVYPTEDEAEAETETVADPGPDHVGDPLPDYECCPGEMWLRIKTYDRGIDEFNTLVGKLTAKKDLTGLYGTARALGESIRFRLYPDPALRFSDYLTGFLACLTVMVQTGVIPADTIPEAEPSWDALLREWSGETSHV